MKETTIKMDKSIKEWLRDQGKKSETFQDIILRLIKSSLKKEVLKT